MISKPGFARTPPCLATVFVLASVCILTTAACAPPEQPRHERSLIQVGRNVLVSGDHAAAAHSEYFAHADPSDSTRMAVCSMIVDPTRSRLSTGIYVSHDAGATWGIALNDTISRWGTTWDPACAFGPGGMVYFASGPTRGDPRIAYESHVILHFFRSTDGGLTWSEPVLGPFVDNADLVVDWTGGPYHGHVYAVGVRVEEEEGELPRRHVSLVVSADSGRSYAGPVDMLIPKDWFQGHVGAPVVHPDGRVLVPVDVRPPFQPTPPAPSPTPWWDPPWWEAHRDTATKNFASVVTVTEGGRAIHQPRHVAKTTPCTPDGGPPEIAVDHSDGPFHGRAYVAFADHTYGRCQIMLSWSDDGEEWASPLPVDDPRIPLDSAGPNAFMPDIAVNRDGVVGITWLDRREDPFNQEFRQRFTASLDGGESVLPSVAVSEAAHTYARGEGEREGYAGLGAVPGPRDGSSWIAIITGGAHRTYEEVGDYVGMMVAADGRFHPVWVDNRTGVAQLYTAPVEVAGKARTPAEWNADLGRNVTDSVAVLVNRSTFDAASCSFDVSVDLLNRWSEPLDLPLTVKVEQMFSQIGVPWSEGPIDGLGRPEWIVGEGGVLPRDSFVTYETRIVLEECATLEGKAAVYRHDIDARMSGTPVAGYVGQKILAMRVSIFERKR